MTMRLDEKDKIITEWYLFSSAIIISTSAIRESSVSFINIFTSPTIAEKKSQHKVRMPFYALM